MPKTEFKKRKSRSLAVTLTITFSVLSLVVLLIASIAEMYFNFQTQQRVIASQQRLIAQDAASTVRNFIQEKFSVMETAVNLGNLVKARPEEQRSILEKLLGHQPAFRQLVLFGTGEQELVSVSRKLYSAPSLLTEQLKSDIFSQLSQGKTYISPVFVDEVTSEPVVIMVVPITDALGDFKGMLMAGVNLKFMWDLVSRIKIGDKGLAYVVDRQGNLIAFYDVSRVLAREDLTHLKEVNKFVNGEELASEVKVEISKGIQGTYVAATYVALGTPDWAVMTELPVLEAYGTIVQNLIISLGILFLSFVLVVVASIYLSKRITKPLIKLRDATIEIGKGRLDSKIEIETKDEIGQLAASFNEMVAKLKEFYGTLEVMVKERTKELEEIKTSLEIRVAARTKELSEQAGSLDEKVKEKTKELQEKIEEMEKFNSLAVGRELKMMELKQEIKKLKEKLEKNKGHNEKKPRIQR